MRNSTRLPAAPAAGICAAALCFAIGPVGRAAPSSASAAAPYASDAAASRLEFIGIQAGAPFRAVFHAFTAAIDFSPDALASTRIEVVIDLKSVDTMDQDRDDTIRGVDLFDVAHFPRAHYVTHGAAIRTAAGYAAGGTLTLRGVAKEVPIEFTFAPGTAGAKMIGTAKLKRLDFGVGQGDWNSTESVGDEVRVSFSLALNPRAPR